jgi:tartrate-resistant acid phosphatase type 5
VVLGNHDYKGDPQAEIDYTKIDRRWNMPDRYYTKTMNLSDDTTQQVLFAFIDTSPWISQYYASPDHVNQVQSQDTMKQRKWLESVLSNAPRTVKWKIVVGHHPLYTGGNRIKAESTLELNRLLKPIFDQYQVDLYICGHDHNLQYIKPQGWTHYFVSGAGSETTPVILHPEGGKYAMSENGFMAFSLTKEELLVQVVRYTGQILYKNIIRK